MDLLCALAGPALCPSRREAPPATALPARRLSYHLPQAFLYCLSYHLPQAFLPLRGALWCVRAGYPTRKRFLPFAQRYALLLSAGDAAALPRTPAGFVDWYALEEGQVSPFHPVVWCQRICSLLRRAAASKRSSPP